MRNKTNVYRSSWRFTNKCQNILPANYFGVKLYETWPPFTAPIMRASLLGGHVEYIPLALLELLSTILHPALGPRGYAVGHFFNLPCPLVSSWIWPLEHFSRRPEEERRVCSGHLSPRCLSAGLHGLLSDNALHTAFIFTLCIFFSRYW